MKKINTKYFFILFAIFLVGIGFFVIFKLAILGTVKYKTLYIGMAAAEKAGDSIIWAPPYDKVPESDFFIYSLGDKAMCVGSDCGLGAYFAECLGGWVSAYKNIGEIEDYGLKNEGFNPDKDKVVTVADKNGIIVGIYPGAGIRNIPYIMKRHRGLFNSDLLDYCLEEMPSVWK